MATIKDLKFDDKNFNSEVWHKVDGFDSYEVSNLGRIRIAKNKKLRKLKTLKNGKKKSLKKNSNERLEKNLKEWSE